MQKRPLIKFNYKKAEKFKRIFNKILNINILKQLKNNPFLKQK